MARQEISARDIHRKKSSRFFLHATYAKKKSACDLYQTKKKDATDAFFSTRPPLSSLQVPSYAPQQLRAPNGATITAFVAGTAHSAFLAGAQWYVMGSNAEGQCGVGSPAAVLPVPQPLRAPGGRLIAAVALGGAHSAVLTGGQCYVFGANGRGQLGLGHLSSEAEPRLLEPPNGAAVTAVALGDAHSAFRAGDEWYVMGANGHGQLGLGHTRDQYVPRRLPSPTADPIDAMVLGGQHSALFAGGRCASYPDPMSEMSCTYRPRGIFKDSLCFFSFILLRTLLKDPPP